MRFPCEVTKSLHARVSLTFSQVCVALRGLPSMPVRLCPVSGCPLTSTMRKNTEDSEGRCRAAWEWGWVEAWEECPRGFLFLHTLSYINHIRDLFYMWPPFYRYTFGPALFVAWIGGGVLVVGGILKSLAFREMLKDKKPRYEGRKRKKKQQKLTPAAFCVCWFVPDFAKCLFQVHLLQSCFNRKQTIVLELPVLRVLVFPGTQGWLTKLSPTPGQTQRITRETSNLCERRKIFHIEVRTRCVQMLREDFSSFLVNGIKDTDIFWIKMSRCYGVCSQLVVMISHIRAACWREAISQSF